MIIKTNYDITDLIMVGVRSYVNNSICNCSECRCKNRHWYTENNEGKVEIYEANDNRYYGKLIWFKESKDTKGNPEKDLKSGKELRNEF